MEKTTGMELQRYEMGVMDIYPILANKTEIENNPFLQVKLKEQVNPEKLYQAVLGALKRHPLFQCRICIDKEIYLETNPNKITLIHTPINERPKTFGKATQAYPWQVCYFETEISFEWCHGITDGRGGLAFFMDILNHYFDVVYEEPPSIDLELGLESFYDKAEKGIPQRKQEQGFQTMHNCIVSKVITYVNRFDSMEFSLVCTIYRAVLELAAQKENIVVEATEKVDLIKLLMGIKPRILRKGVLHLVAKAMKHSDSNFTFTYLGKLHFEKNVAEGIEDFHFRSWTDFGECNIAAVDFNGTLILNICENYKNKNIIPTFIRLCKEYGIHIEEVECLEYEQANYRMDG